MQMLRCFKGCSGVDSGMLKVLGVFSVLLWCFNCWYHAAMQFLECFGWLPRCCYADAKVF